MVAREKRAKGGRFNRVKYFIRVPWLGAAALAFFSAGGVRSVDPL